MKHEINHKELANEYADKFISSLPETTDRELLSIARSSYLCGFLDGTMFVEDINDTQEEWLIE